MFGCCPSVDDSNIRAFVERMNAQRAVSENAGNSTLCKIITWGIAFFSLALMAAVGAMIATGTMAATGGSAVIAFSFFIFIITAIAIYVGCRTQRQAIAELNAFLGENPQYDGRSTPEYDVRRDDNGIYHFSKRDKEEQALEGRINHMSTVLGARFSRDRVLNVNSVPLLVETTSDAVTTRARHSTQRFNNPDDIYLHQTRVCFSIDPDHQPTPLLLSDRAAMIHFATVSEMQLGVYQFVGYGRGGELAQAWTVNTHKQFRLQTLHPETGEILQTEPIYIPDELLSIDIESKPSLSHVAHTQNHILVKLY